MEERKSLFDLELELEEAMTKRGADRLMNDMNKQRERGSEFLTAVGKDIINAKLFELAEAIKNWIEVAGTGKASRNAVAVKLVRDMDVNVLAYLTLRQTIANISTETTEQRLAMAIGGSIEDEIMMAQFREADSKEWSKTVQAAKKRVSDHNKRYYCYFIADEYIDIQKWTPRERLMVGLKMIDILRTSIGIIDIQKVSRNNKTIQKVSAKPEVLQWMHDRADLLSVLRPVYEPMVIRPRQWTNPYNGGYISRNVKPIRLVKRGSKDYFKTLEKADMPIVYGAVNAMQDTPWQINTFVFEVMTHFWERGISIGGLPPREGIPLPEKPWDIEENEEARRKWRKAAAEVYSINTANRSKNVQFEIMLDIARRYKDFRKIYLPYQLDFRGRVYAVSALNCQGSDVAKALLRFSNGKPLGSEGWKWLAVHGANLIGNDKISFEDRVNFILDQEEVIRAIVADPYSNRQWAGEIGGCEVDCPWEFLGWCQEWVGFLDHGETFVSKIPVAMDGSCSGLQHYSAMLRDQRVGSAVNLLPADKPSDVYRMVAEEVLVAVEKDRDNGTEDELTLVDDEPRVFEGTKTLAQQWLDFGINRKVAKRAVMTLCYGSKQYGFSDQLMEDFIKKGRMAGDKLPFTGSGKRACNYLAKKIWDAVRTSITKASEAMAWLQEVAHTAAGIGQPVHWETPLGFPVWHEYKKIKKERVETAIRGSTRAVSTIQVETPELDSRKQASAIAPNFIHSCDATHMMLSTVRAKQEGINSFAMIHDSFGCPAGDAQKMYSIVRECMIEIYKNTNPLQNLKDDVESYSGLKLPEIPKEGTLDIDEIMNSRYCFA